MERACFQIDKQGTQLGLHLINPEGDRFFLYDQQLLSMWENPDRYVLVKRRNRDERQAIGYHAGQILGAIDKQAGSVNILLFFGPVDRDLDYDVGSKALKMVVSRQVYCLQEEDLKAVVKGFEVSRRHRDKFDEMKISGRALALYER